MNNAIKTLLLVTVASFLLSGIVLAQENEEQSNHEDSKGVLSIEDQEYLDGLPEIERENVILRTMLGIKGDDVIGEDAYTKAQACLPVGARCNRNRPHECCSNDCGHSAGCGPGTWCCFP